MASHSGAIPTQLSWFAGIYWVSANIIEELRKSAVFSEKILD